MIFIPQSMVGRLEDGNGERMKANQLNFIIFGGVGNYC